MFAKHTWLWEGKRKFLEEERGAREADVKGRILNNTCRRKKSLRYQKEELLTSRGGKARVSKGEKGKPISIEGGPFPLFKMKKNAKEIFVAGAKKS